MRKNINKNKTSNSVIFYIILINNTSHTHTTYGIIIGDLVIIIISNHIYNNNINSHRGVKINKMLHLYFKLNRTCPRRGFNSNSRTLRRPRLRVRECEWIFLRHWEKLVGGEHTLVHVRPECLYTYENIINFNNLCQTHNVNICEIHIHIWMSYVIGILFHAELNTGEFVDVRPVMHSHLMQYWDWKKYSATGNFRCALS